MRKSFIMLVAGVVTAALTISPVTHGFAATPLDGIVDHSYESYKLETVTKCMNGEEHDHSVCVEQKEGFHLNIPEISPMMTSTKCGRYAPIVCAAEAINYGTGTHKYSFLWKDTCTVTYFKSRSASICASCYNVCETYGYHDCWQVHRDCGIGEYDVCPCEIS